MGLSVDLGANINDNTFKIKLHQQSWQITHTENETWVVDLLSCSLPGLNIPAGWSSSCSAHLSGKCRLLPPSISHFLQGRTSCSQAELPHKEEEALLLLDFIIKSLTEDWSGDYCTLCQSWLVLCSPHSGFHGTLWAVAECSQLSKSP